MSKQTYFRCQTSLATLAVDIYEMMETHSAKGFVVNSSHQVEVLIERGLYVDKG